MDTPSYDIEIRQGATFQIALAYRDPDGKPIDLSGFSAQMQIRDRVGGRVLAELSSANGRITIEPAEGRLHVEIPRSITKNMALSTPGVYDLFITSEQDFAVCVVEGKVTFRPSVTRG